MMAKMCQHLPYCDNIGNVLWCDTSKRMPPLCMIARAWLETLGFEISYQPLCNVFSRSATAADAVIPMHLQSTCCLAAG